MSGPSPSSSRGCGVGVDVISSTPGRLRTEHQHGNADGEADHGDDGAADERDLEAAQAARRRRVVGVERIGLGPAFAGDARCVTLIDVADLNPAARCRRRAVSRDASPIARMCLAMSSSLTRRRLWISDSACTPSVAVRLVSCDCRRGNCACRCSSYQCGEKTFDGRDFRKWQHM
jgi:hypothetical protein